MKTVAFLILLYLSTPLLAQPHINPGNTADTEAKKLGIPTQLAEWKLVRHVPGEHNHFLYANHQRTISLFITETKTSHPLQAQTGWKTVVLGAGQAGFVHQDSRNPERSAVVFKHQTQRRMLLGKLSEAELIRLAKQIR
jgi:hypothetical protein